LSRAENGIGAVKGVPFRGRRTGNWLTKEDAQKWLNASDIKTLKVVGDRALLAILIGCFLPSGFFLHEISGLSVKETGKFV